MKRSSLFFALLAGTGLFSTSLFSAVTFDVQAEYLKTSGGAAMPTTGLVMLVASTTDGTFGVVNDGVSLAAGSFLDGGDDLILKTWDLSSSGTPGLFADVSGSLTFSGNWNTGDALALVWFPTLNLATATASGGTEYGLFTTATPTDGSGAWATPADLTANHALYMFTTEASNLPGSPPGSVLASASLASNTVQGIPEPSRMMFLGLAMIGLVFRRRR